MQYIIRNLHKFTEQDDFENGCIPDTGTIYSVDVSFSGDTVEQVIQKAADFIGCEISDVVLDACEEKGRVDFAQTENVYGRALTDIEIEKWNAGEFRAWYAVYTGYVEKIERVKLT